jgi:RNA recognition motif-containing protein
MMFPPPCPIDRKSVSEAALYFLSFLSMSTQGTKRLFVGNVPFRIDAQDLRALFEEVAPVLDFFWPTDRETGRKKGFCFVDVAEADMAAVIEAMNGKDVMGRQLAINEAQPCEERAPRQF